MSYSRKIHFLGAMSALKIINKVRKSKYYRTDLKKNEDLIVRIETYSIIFLFQNLLHQTFSYPLNAA